MPWLTLRLTGSVFQQYLPKGVLKVINSSEVSSSWIPQKPALGSSLEDTLAFANVRFNSSRAGIYEGSTSNFASSPVCLGRLLKDSSAFVTYGRLLHQSVVIGLPNNHAHLKSQEFFFNCGVRLMLTFRGASENGTASSFRYSLAGSLNLPIRSNWLWYAAFMLADRGDWC